MPQQPTYQDLLEELLALQQAQYAQQGGGYMGADPYAPQGGFPAPPMPNGKMPQYRTQGSGYMSDGTVSEYVGKALPNSDQFSTDAFINADPALKPLIARAIGEAGHDPYAAYAAFDEGSYREALMDMAVRELGIQGNDDGSYFRAAYVDGADADGNGKIDNGESWTNEQAIADVIAARGDGQTAMGSGFVDPLTGREFQRRETYSNALRAKMGAYEGALDNFFTQAAPSTERNLNDLDYVHGRLGGMPFPGQGSGADGMSYRDAGPGFGPAPGGGGPAQNVLPDFETMKASEWKAAYTKLMQEDSRARGNIPMNRPVTRRSTGNASHRGGSGPASVGRPGVMDSLARMFGRG